MRNKDIMNLTGVPKLDPPVGVRVLPLLPESRGGGMVDTLA